MTTALVLGLGLIAMCAGGGIFAAALAGIGPDSQRQITPGQFLGCIVALISAVILLLLT